MRRFLNASRVRTLAVLAGVGVLAAPVLADPVFTPQAASDVTLPITPTSLATVAAIAGAGVLVAWAAIKIGFAIAKRMPGKLSRAVS